MAIYLVRARPRSELVCLKRQLDNGTIERLRPFGSELTRCLRYARLDEDGWAWWEATCYCSPPLKQERSVLDVYFSEIHAELIRQGEGWARVDEMPSLWFECSGEDRR